jgi:hypothetical protein
MPISLTPQENKHRDILKYVLEESQPVLGIGVSASWDVRDERYLNAIFEEVRTNKSQSKWFDAFINQMNDQYMDRRSGRDSHLEAQTVSVDLNALTTEGLRLANQNITGEVNSRFLWMLSGTGNTTKPTMYSEQLEKENARVPIDQQGWFFARGTTLVQGCKFPTTLPSATIVEFGSANVGDKNSADHTLFWRSRITSSSQYIPHIQNGSIYLHVHVIDFRSIVNE